VVLQFHNYKTPSPTHWTPPGFSRWSFSFAATL